MKYSSEKKKYTSIGRPSSIHSDYIRKNNTLSSRPGSRRSSSYLMNPQRYKTNFSRREKRRFSALSIGAGSSVSNAKSSKALTTCSCNSLSRGKVLQKIAEEMEIEHKEFSIVYDKKQRWLKYTKCLTIFLIVLALIVCVTVGVLHYYVKFFTQELILNQGDVKIIQESSLFCGGISSISEHSGVRLISFQNSPSRKPLVYTRTENKYLSPNKIWKRKFYLLKDSIIYTEISTDISVDAFHFAGYRNFTMWEQRQESDTYINKITCCRGAETGKKQFFLKADRDDDYYVAVKSNEQVDASVTIELEFARKTYDFTKTSSSCVAEKQRECSIDYAFNTNDEIAIEVPIGKKSNDISQSGKVEWKCSGRAWFYCVLFLGVFLLFLLLVMLVYVLITKYIIPCGYCICAREKKKKRANPVEFYDNFGKAGSDFLGSDDIYKHRQSYGSRSDVIKPMYGDDTSRISDTSQYLGNLLQTCSVRSTMTGTQALHSQEPLYHDEKNLETIPNSSRKRNIPQQNIATIYNERAYDEQADSGISVNPDFHQRQALNAHELMELQELQFQRLKYMRNQQRQAALVEAPSVKNLLCSSPSSVTNNGIYNKSDNVLPYPENVNNNIVYSSNQRANSVISQRNYYDNRQSGVILNDSVERGEYFL